MEPPKRPAIDRQLRRAATMPIDLGSTRHVKALSSGPHVSSLPRRIVWGLRPDREALFNRRWPEITMDVSLLTVPGDRNLGLRRLQPLVCIEPETRSTHLVSQPRRLTSSRMALFLIPAKVPRGAPARRAFATPRSGCRWPVQRARHSGSLRDPRPRCERPRHYRNRSRT